jgi:hypothetical protein
MGFWDNVVNGSTAAPPQRAPSTPSRGEQWYPTPQYQPSSAEPWAQPPVDSVQRQGMEISQDVLDFMEDSGTFAYGKGGSVTEMRSDGTQGSVTSAPMFLKEIPDDIDPGMLSMADRHEYYWQRAARAPLRGRSKALRVENQRCPECDDPRYFTRVTQKKNINGVVMVPAPMCMACGYTGDSIQLSQLN